MRVEPKFCTGCGRKMDEIMEPTDRFSAETGERVMLRTRKCPQRLALEKVPIWISMWSTERPGQHDYVIQFGSGIWL